MYEEIAVNTDTLKTDVAAMQEVLNRVQEKAKRMFESIKALDHMWEGTAHDEFIRQVSIDYDKMEELCSVINQLIDCMEYADNQYIACEGTVQTIIQSIRV